MRAIYIDESAHADEYYLGALVADAAAVRHIERDLDRLASMVCASTPGLPQDLEIHAYDVFQGKNDWSTVDLGLRVKVCTTTARVVARSGARLFFRGVDVAALKRQYTNPYPAHDLVLGQLLCEIDKRLGHDSALGSLGICHADEHHTAVNSRRNLQRFKAGTVAGYNDRLIENIGDTIYFGPSHASRLLQAVDVATFFLNRARNVQETHPAAVKASARIARDLGSCLERNYVWVPGA